MSEAAYFSEIGLSFQIFLTFLLHFMLDPDPKTAPEPDQEMEP